MKRSRLLCSVMLVLSLTALLSFVYAPSDPIAYFSDDFNAASAPTFTLRWTNSTPVSVNKVSSILNFTAGTVSSRISLFQAILELDVNASANGNFFGFRNATDYLGFQTLSGQYQFVSGNLTGSIMPIPIGSVDGAFHNFALAWFYLAPSTSSVQYVQFWVDGVSLSLWKIYSTTSNMPRGPLPIVFSSASGASLIQVDWVAYAPTGVFTLGSTSTSIIPVTSTSVSVVTKNTTSMSTTFNPTTTLATTFTSTTSAVSTSYTATSYGASTSYPWTETVYGPSYSTIATSVVTVYGVSTQTIYTSMNTVSNYYTQTANYYSTIYAGITTAYNTYYQRTTVKSAITSFITNATRYVTGLAAVTVTNNTIYTNQTISNVLTKNIEFIAGQPSNEQLVNLGTAVAIGFTVWQVLKFLGKRRAKKEVPSPSTEEKAKPTVPAPTPPETKPLPQVVKQTKRKTKPTKPKPKDALDAGVFASFMEKNFLSNEAALKEMEESGA